jgi:hypothetical protein
MHPKQRNHTARRKRTDKEILADQKKRAKDPNSEEEEQAEAPDTEAYNDKRRQSDFERNVERW